MLFACQIFSHQGPYEIFDFILVHDCCYIVSFFAVFRKEIFQIFSSLEPKVQLKYHCVVSLSKNINPSLVLVQPKKTRPFIIERLLMGRKESNQTNQVKY